MENLGFGSRHARGRDVVQRRGKGNCCSKGKEEIRRARKGVEQKKHKRRPHESTALPEGRLPAGVSAAITKSSCIPLRSSET